MYHRGESSMSIYDLLTEQENGQVLDVMYGVTVAVVTNIDDPDKLGRVKVKLINRDSSQNETDFIRVMTPMTGKEWGSFFFPEVGDEVLVAFQHGDIAKPYVIGALWNKNYKPPVEIKDGKNDIRKIKTKRGHEIIFNDEEGEERIDIKTPNELSLSLDDKNEVITLQDKNEKNLMKIDTKNGQIQIESEKKIKLNSGDASIELNAQGNSITIESGTSMKIKSQNISIEATNTLDIKATNLLNVKSSGTANIKGAVVKIN